MIPSGKTLLARTRQSRYGFAAFLFLTFLGAWSALRLSLLLSFGPDRLSGGDTLLAFLAGVHRDVFIALVFVIPQLLWFCVVPGRWFPAIWHRVVFWTVWFIAGATAVFLLVAEFYFFEEFRSRFNTVAVDYIIYPHEVFINIWDSYPVVPVIAACAFCAGAWVWLARRLFTGMWREPVPTRIRWLWLGGVVLLVTALSQTVNLKGVKVSADRTLNEIANNGTIAFACAAWTRHLDYAAFYRTIPEDEAYQRVRRLLATTNSQFTAEGQTIRRKVAGDPSRPRLNVVMLLEESLGSEFWGCLGRKEETLTPEMDKLATEEGMLFTNIYASGNRTVRGMEGLLSSFPPLPGDSIVKREFSDNVETIARVLKRDGYSTVFLYGGRGLFDGMRSYAVRNGYDQFIEQKHFKEPIFTTVWGVSDEDLFARAIEEFRALDRQGQPFLGTVLSVSNHKPYTYPAGRIPEDPNRQKRNHAVKYSDYALGQFFKAARKESFWTNTLFVVVADHGARVYGSLSLPLESYEIPLFFLGPAVVKAPSRISTLGCSLDVAPTILGLIGRPYETLFFGRDLLQEPPGEGRALLNHNRDIGMYSKERLIVLGLRQSLELFGGDPKVAPPQPITSPTSFEEELEKDTIALYQVADDLYIHQRYRIDGDSPPADAARTEVSDNR